MSELQKYLAPSLIEVDHPLAEGIDGYECYQAVEVDARLALMQRAVDWCLENGAERQDGGIAAYSEVPAEFAEIIRVQQPSAPSPPIREPWINGTATSSGENDGQ